jgi:hypothetical protein
MTNNDQQFVVTMAISKHTQVFLTRCSITTGFPGGTAIGHSSVVCHRHGNDGHLDPAAIHFSVA